jgi:aminoglycoside phosphotransferase (APT) family kinase protein
VNVWRPEILVDSNLARELLERAFPELRPVTVEPLAEGWDNTVFLVNGTLVFRFPRRSIAAPLIRTELQLLPWLSNQLPIEIPVPTYAGEPSEHYPWFFTGYRVIPGLPVQTARPSPEARSAWAVPLARFLKALHALPVSDARQHGAMTDSLGRLHLPKQTLRAKDRLTILVKAGVLNDVERLVESLDSLHTVVPRQDAVVHGDLHASQILLNDRHQIAGVIDWGDVHIGDPALDFAAVHALIPRESHAAFQQAYGDIAPETWTVAKARALWITIAGLAAAVDTGDQDTVLEMRATLTRVIQ